MKLNDDLMMKIIIVGDSGVGKTNLLERFVKDKFTGNMVNTVGVDFIGKTVQIQDKIVKLQFWDTAGQEKYRSISSAYYKSADGVIIVYDTTNRESYQNIDIWLEEIQKYSKEGLIHLLIGNKTDLAEQREVTTEEAIDFSDGRGLFLMEVSAKTNDDDCVGKAFGVLLKEIFDKKVRQGEIFLNEGDNYTSEFKFRTHVENELQSERSLEDEDQIKRREGCC